MFKEYILCEIKVNTYQQNYLEKRKIDKLLNNSVNKIGRLQVLVEIIKESLFLQNKFH